MAIKLSIQTCSTEVLAEYIALKMNGSLNKQGIELEKMKLGVSILLINLIKLITIFTTAMLFHLLRATAIMLLVFAMIRRTAFGLHARNNIVCMVTSPIPFVLGAYVSSHLMLNNYSVLIAFLVMIFLLFKYSPADTESHPLIGREFRNQLKKQSLGVGVLLMTVALLVPSGVIKTLITLSVSFQIISILPITYKIFKRRYKNYEKYE